MKRSITIALLSLTLGGCSSMGFLNPGNWGGSAGEPEGPAELIELEEAMPVETLWNHSAGAGTGDFLVRLVPFVEMDRIFVADRRGLVQAVDRESGRVLWSRDTDVDISGGPGAGSGLVLVGTVDGEVLALDPETGEERWRAWASSEILSVPAAEAGVVVVHSVDGKLFGLDAYDGQRLWTYERAIPVLTRTLSMEETAPPIMNK